MITSEFLLLFIPFVLQAWSVSGQNDSCVSIRDCPIAIQMLSTQPSPFIVKSLRSYFCGFQETQPQIDCNSLTDFFQSYSDLLPETCGIIKGNRIFGGQEVDLYEFPWMVLISYKTQKGLEFKCGGTLINNRYVLTAAHCIVGLNIAGVRVGEHDIATDTDCQGAPPDIVCESRIQDLRVEEQITHEDYAKSPEIINDIGLLRLKREVDFVPRNARPICLPTSKSLQNKDLTGLSAVIAGWGFTETGSASSVLLKVRVPVSKKEDCEAAYSRGRNRTDFSKKLCAGENGKDSCGGDSGGPLMIEGMHNGVTRYVQHGIVSYGPRICASNYPGVYTDVSKYIDWILSNMRK